MEGVWGTGFLATFTVPLHQTVGSKTSFSRHGTVQFLTPLISPGLKFRKPRSTSGYTGSFPPSSVFRFLQAKGESILCRTLHNLSRRRRT